MSPTRMIRLLPLAALMILVAAIHGESMIEPKARSEWYSLLVSSLNHVYVMASNGIASIAQ